MKEYEMTTPVTCPRLVQPLTFEQACFISGMSADTCDFLNATLTDDQKADFVQNERETVTDEGFDLAINNPLFPKYYSNDKLYL
jgi:hypothetical protein